MKPGDFHLGVLEFFSILVPGFIVTSVGIVFVGDISLNTDLNAYMWISIAVASYVLGHILFSIGTLWDGLYEKCTPRGNEALLEKIKLIRAIVNQGHDTKKVNQYQWCRALLLNKYPDAFMDVARKEADSKLFRSLIFPLVLFALYWFFVGIFDLSLLSLLLSGVAFWRFRGQRFKACKLSYTHVITLSNFEHWTQSGSVRTPDGSYTG